MFAHLTERLNHVIKNLTGQGRLTEDNIQESLHDIRLALLEADVALPVIKEFINHIQQKALGAEVLGSLTPGQALIKIVHDELITLMGESCAELNLHTEPPAVILLAGLQGCGKTTTVAKLARWLKHVQKKSVLVASTDIYRPAAIEQLKTLAASIDVSFYPSDATQDPVTIAREAVHMAKTKIIDIVIIDTAGRLHVDHDMMDEIQRLHAALQPIETLFVVDSMTGQDAANTAKAFNDALPLTGVILSKTDGDARGGAALSVRYITGKPIKFMGVGEKIDNLEPFYPDRVASRILGMGDIIGLVEEVSQKIDRQKAEKLAKKIKKSKSFDLEDFRDQMREIGKMGGIMGIMSKLPGMSQVPDGIKNQLDETVLKRYIAIIDSMTYKERRFPDHIKGSHKRRIATGSGTDIQTINQLLKQFLKMQKMLKKSLQGKGMMNMLRRMQGGGGFPSSGAMPW